MQLIIFDWEGTLVKDLGAQFDCLARSAKLLGLPVATNKLKLFSSPWHFLDSPISGLTSMQSAQLRQSFLGGLQDLNKPTKETKEVLKRLKDHNLKLAVATNLNRATFDSELAAANLDGLIDYSATPSEYASKPAPDMLLGILEQSGISVEQALFVGDAPTDIEAAIAAKMKSCWLTLCDGLKPDPDYRIERLGELFSLDLT